ncbi:MAG: nuclear transport factor 2 family protein [Gemmatimonadetes bacterium]|nr:nuclear transport factor 2 family protein [Gemmatimonadota bacterium]
MNGHDMLRKVVAIYNRHDWDALARLWAEDAECRVPGGKVLRGGREWASYSRETILPFSDARVLVHQAIVEGNAVVQESSLIATHDGPLQAPYGRVVEPTGRRLVIPYVEIFRIEGDLVGDTHLYFDPAEPMRQIGLS